MNIPNPFHCICRVITQQDEEKGVTCNVHDNAGGFYYHEERDPWGDK